MERSVYVGHHERTRAAMLSTPERVARGTSLRFKNCEGLPWDVGARGVMVESAGEKAARAQERANRMLDMESRRRYITELDRCGCAGPGRALARRGTKEGPEVCTASTATRLSQSVKRRVDFTVVLV